MADAERRAKLEILFERGIPPLLERAERVTIAGDGDPFSSKHYRRILTSLSRERYPNLELTILTNGVLFDEAEWERFSNLDGVLGEVSVSVDAATPETYALLRRGGDWERLVRNLEHIASQRRAGRFDTFRLNFAVQALNYREAPAFVHLAEGLTVDEVQFDQIHNQLESFSPDAFFNANVFDPEHPQHSELLEILDELAAIETGINLHIPRPV